MDEVENQRSHSLFADIPFVITAVICGAVLLFLGRSLTFLQDEWPSITFVGGPLDYLRPVNQHWSTFPLLLYRGTFGVVGLRSYLPYLAEVILLHLLAVGAAYALMRRRIGPVFATVCAIPLLLLGSGGENLFWAFQTGFVGSVMFGLWAVFFIERPGRAAPFITSFLLLASFTSSGMGLFFPVVAGGRTILDPRLRRRTIAVAPPLAAYALWFGLVGRDQVDGGRIYVETLLVRFVVRGIVFATETSSGLTRLPDGHLWGLVAFLGLSTLVGYQVVRRHRCALAAGCVMGVVAMYVIIAFVRLHADPGYDHAVSSRYVYVAAFLLVLAVVDLLPERKAWRSGYRFAAAVPATVVLLLVLSVASNVEALRAKRADYQHAANVTRAFVDLALTRGHEPWVDRDAARGWMPSVAVLERTIALHGSPLHDDLFPGVVKAPDAASKETALLALIGDGFRIEQPRVRSRYAAVDIGRARPSGVSSRGPCVHADLDPGAALWTFGLPSPARVRFVASTHAAGRVFLAHEGGPSRQLFPQFKAGIANDVVIPDIGDDRLWSLAVDSPLSAASFDACVLVAGPDRSAHEIRFALRRWE